MSMTKGFSNVFRIPELRKKILITLGLVFVCRLISQIPTPGVDWRALQNVIETAREANTSPSVIKIFLRSSGMRNTFEKPFVIDMILFLFHRRHSFN